MAKKSRSTVKLYPAERDELDGLQTMLRERYGVKASRDDIVGAMTHGVTPDQLFGMLLEYQKHAEWGQGSGSEAG